MKRPSSSELDLDLDTGRELETHERVDGLRGGLVNVDETVVGARLEVLAGVLVDVGGAEDAVDAALGGEGHRARDGRLGRLGRIDDLVARGRHVLHLEGLQPDANLLRRHGGLREERSGEVEKKGESPVEDANVESRGGGDGTTRRDADATSRRLRTRAV